MDDHSRLRVDFFLPYKEQFVAQNPGAVSTVVHNLVAYSPAWMDSLVVGRPVHQPLGGLHYLAVRPRRAWMLGRNIGLAASYIAKMAQSKSPDLVEVHNRCHVARYMAENLGREANVVLYLHNDPRTMRGSREPYERLWLANNLRGVICISNYIKSCFCEGLPSSIQKCENILVVHNGVNRWLRSQPRKEKLIVIAGRIVPEKGILECSKALARILPYFPDWRAEIIGGRYFSVQRPSKYEKEVKAALRPLGAQAKMTGFLPPRQVRELQARAAISVCPSVWNEPLGLVVLEALAAGCALIATRRGGIPEVADGRALLVDEPTVEAFADTFEHLLSDPDRVASLQQKAWDDYPFSARVMADRAACCRQELLDRYRRIERSTGQPKRIGET